MKEKIKKIFPIEINFEVKNCIEYLKPKTITLKDRKRVIFMDAASYNNLGDQAIAYAIERFIKDNFKEYEYIEIPEKNFLRNLKYLKKNITEEDIICLSGGGNMGNLYPRYEAIRRKVIKNFKNNRIIIFPQTIDYENNKYGNRELEKSRRIYNSNENLIICAREKKSYNKMKEIYNNVKLVPDIVLYLCGKFTVKNNVYSNTWGICLRNDKESMISEDMKKQIINFNKEKVELTTMSNIKMIDKTNREEILISKINEFANCKAVITDRLHGMIFSMIANVPCIAFDNSNRKVSGVYNTVNQFEKKVLIGNIKKNIDFEQEIKELKKEHNKLDEELFGELKKCFF